MKILSNKIVFLVFATAMLAGTAYAKSIFDIEYPIAELGGCVDKKACKAYCDVSENQDACDNFAASYGVGKAKERQEDRDTRKDIALKDGGPGNCASGSSDPVKSCHAYCDKAGNMNECVAYGKSRGLLKGEELDEAEKVVKALASGIALPEGCTDGESCKQMCEEPKNVGVARACFAFAEKAGLLPPHIDRAQAEKVFRLMEEGKAPFKSPKDFKKCENPENDEIMEKCIKFGEENGLIPQKDLEMIKKTGGKGPGGCRGKNQCDTYCSEHQEECMKFAEEHNLISPEDKARMEEGMLRFKEEISRMPAEVKQCLDSAVGSEKLEQLVAGKQNPTREFGDTMRSCFESVFGAPGERDMSDMREGGFEPREGGFPGMMRPEEGEGMGAPFMQRGSTSSFRGGEPFMQGRPQQGGMFPPQVEACVKGKIGESAFNEIGKTNTGRDSALGQAISACMREFEGPRPGGFPQGGERGQMMPPQYDRGQGTTSRMLEPRPEGQFDTRMMINPNFVDGQHEIPYGAIPMDGQMMNPPPPYQGGTMQYGAPQTQPYQQMPMEGTMMPPPGGDTGTFTQPPSGY